MNRRLAALAAAFAAAVTLGLASAHATAPGRNGRIAFERYRFSDKPLWAEIWVTNPDGTGERRITHAPRGYLDRGPDWSPDSSRIAFNRCAPDDGRCTLWVVKPDGNDERMLSPSCRQGVSDPSSCPDDSFPAYSPDGHHLAFGRFDGAEDSIVIADTNLRHPRQVFSFGHSRGAPDVGNPAWSPDGKRIAFVVSNANGTKYKPVNGIAISIVNADGTGLHRLTPWKLRAGAGPEGIDWSPDGTRILFRTHPHAGTDAGGNLYTIRPDGSGLRQLTHFEPYDTAPGALRTGSYSPDGSSILFATYHGAVTVSPSSSNLPDVFVMSADGTDVRPVTRARNWDGDPDWGPS